MEKNEQPYNIAKRLSEMEPKGLSNEELLALRTEGLTPEAAQLFAEMWLSSDSNIDKIDEIAGKFITDTASADEEAAFRRYMEKTGLKQTNWTSSYYGYNYQELWDSPKFHKLVKEAYAADPVTYHHVNMISSRNYGIPLDAETID